MISVAAVIVAMMAIQMASLGFSPLLPAIQKDLGASYSQMGLFTGMYGIIALLVSLPAGVFAARIGEKRALLIGLAVTAVGLARSLAGHPLRRRSRVSRPLADRLPYRLHRRVYRDGDGHSGTVSKPHHGHSRRHGGLRVGYRSSVRHPSGSLARVERRHSGVRGNLSPRRGRFRSALPSPALAIVSRCAGPHGTPISGASAVSALRNPIIWSMILLGLINMGGFSVTFFVPYAVKSVFGMGAQDAASIISASYLVSIPLNLGFGYLCDRYSRWNMMIWLAVLLVPASFAVMSRDLLVFRIAVALIVSLGHAATNQIYAIGSSLLPKEEVGKGMGIVGLGSGIFGYLGPQMLGYLRDATGGFTAGWIFVACAAVSGSRRPADSAPVQPQAASCVSGRDTSSHEENRIAGITSNTVPWEILRAAGYTPRFTRG